MNQINRNYFSENRYLRHQKEQWIWLPEKQEWIRNRLWTRSEIDTLLREKDKAVEAGIIQLYRLQTADEQSVGGTRHDNGEGFNHANAGAGTYFAQYLLRSPRNRLAGKHLERARKICLTHARQLLTIANNKLQLHLVTLGEEPLNEK